MGEAAPGIIDSLANAGPAGQIAIVLLATAACVAAAWFAWAKFGKPLRQVKEELTPNGGKSLHDRLLTEIEKLNSAQLTTMRKIAMLESSTRLTHEKQAEPYFETDAEGGNTFVNHAYCRTLGVAPSQALGVSYKTLVFHEDRERYLKGFMRCVQRLDFFKDEVRVYRETDGEGKQIWWVEVQAWPAFYGESLVGSAGSFRPLRRDESAEKT